MYMHWDMSAHALRSAAALQNISSELHMLGRTTTLRLVFLPAITISYWLQKREGHRTYVLR